MTVDVTPILTKARLAVWDALDNWAGTSDEVGALHALDPPQKAGTGFESGIFAKRFRLEKERGTPGEAPTGPGDLPAVTVLPGAVDPEWIENRAMRFLNALDVVVFAKTLAQAEDFIQRCWRAIYRCCPQDSTVSYVKAATGGRNPVNMKLVISPGELGNQDRTKIYVARMTVGIGMSEDPLG